jgi:hypothetical protein
VIITVRPSPTRAKWDWLRSSLCVVQRISLLRFFVCSSTATAAWNRVYAFRSNDSSLIQNLIFCAQAQFRPHELVVFGCGFLRGLGDIYIHEVMTTTKARPKVRRSDGIGFKRTSSLYCHCTAYKCPSSILKDYLGSVCHPAYGFRECAPSKRPSPDPFPTIAM